jgi:hypothetical protein
MSTTMSLPTCAGCCAATIIASVTAHRMADQGRPLESVRFDVTRDLGHERRHDRPFGIGAHRLAREAADLDQMIAVSRHVPHRPLPDMPPLT